MSAARARRFSEGEGGHSAGWYQDPDDPTGVRYWTGRSWTSRRRSRPGWHVIPMDLDTDPSWQNPGGVDRTMAEHHFLDEPEESGSSTGHPSGRASERDVSGVEPELDDSYDDASVDRPLHAERPSRERAFRTEPFTTGPPSTWAGAGFGADALRWTPTGSSPRAAARWGQPPGHAFLSMSSARHARAGGWRQTRVPLLIIAGVTVFAVLALLINLGTGARGRFSPVTVDTTFVTQARSACTAALTRQPASLEASGAPVVDPARLATLLTTLRQVPATPAAAPQVDGWLGLWQHYIAEEDTLSQDRANRRSAGAATASEAALTTASQADAFAEDHGLAACTIEPSSARGLEAIP